MLVTRKGRKKTVAGKKGVKRIIYVDGQCAPTLARFHYFYIRVLNSEIGHRNRMSEKGK